MEAVGLRRRKAGAEFLALFLRAGLEGSRWAGQGRGRGLRVWRMEWANAVRVGL